jgi:predicted DNA-binding protein YlxM (UPF0122 family)
MVKSKTLPKDELYKLYIVEKMSMQKISEHFNCSVGHINNQLKKYNIKTRNAFQSHMIDKLSSID